MKILPLLVASSLFLSSPAFAWEPSLQLGASRTSSGHDTSGAIFVQFQGSPDRWGNQLWVKPIITGGWIEGRSQAGFENDVWVLGGGGRLYWNKNHQPSRWFVEGQILASAGNTDALTGPLQFGTAIGIEGNKWELMVRHLSNAGIKKPNKGETMLLLGYKF